MTVNNFAFPTIDMHGLSRLAQTAPQAQFQGVWSTIEIQPDAFVPQKFSVGVVVQSIGDRLHFKLLDDLEKFSCIYDKSLSEDEIRDVLQSAERTLRAAVRAKGKIEDVTFDTHCLTLSPPKYTSGNNHENSVERLFTETIVMAPFVRLRERGFTSIDTSTARQLVNDELKRIAGLDFAKIVPNDEQDMLLEHDGNHYQLDLNLLPPCGCGSVASAVYKTPQTVEINLLKTSRDLTTYARAKNLNEIGLFVLMPGPSSQLNQSELKRIDSVISENEWKLERDGFRVVSMDSPTDLAKEIYEWAKPAL